ncbi:DUF4145 domain-containing protein [Salisediminibacterium beveridgei]|uniref:DUF4145 domain-containing protein n=1 Tax=Salisediminibacterium beveridgei TaxID=632773 RepID=A0A1D7QXA4_9BACI|nr:DUF4145 domain-containing protein [Salisediminibacterium beveridgei]AOM83588.1 hypothetical protein BBEV_2230 [Salisediminibacterium beveridgei]
MQERSYYYSFLEEWDQELASLARELENSVFTSPRMMLTHARTMVEGVIKNIMKKEGISDISCTGLKDRIMLLQSYKMFPNDVQDAVHEIRKAGNDAAHQTKGFRYSQALKSWEALYVLMKWYMERKGPLKFQMPVYQEPEIQGAGDYDPMELEVRFKSLEESLLKKVDELTANQQNGAAKEPEPDQAEEPAVREPLTVPSAPSVPGETPIRTIRYQDGSLDVPYFLRDAFLLPQRFEKSERFLIKLGAEQQARIMSELPARLDGISGYVKRYGEGNETQFFDELHHFIEEEKVRRKVMLERPGELFLFFRTKYLIMTKQLAELPLNGETFKGIPNFLKQLNEDGIDTVGQLPQELLILAKYDRVGVGMVEKLFNQMKDYQEKNAEKVSS